MAQLPEDQVAVSIVTYEEQMRGWLAFASRAKTPVAEVNAYRKLGRHLERFCEIPIIAFDDRASTVFQGLRKQGVRIGTPDLRIAAITIANNATLLTRNFRDFAKVPGLHFEDWTIG